MSNERELRSYMVNRRSPLSIDKLREYELPKDILCRSYTLRTATRKVYNAERIVMQSVAFQPASVSHFLGFLPRITESALSDAISLSVVLKRPERSFGGSTDSSASSFTEGSTRV